MRESRSDGSSASSENAASSTSGAGLPGSSPPSISLPRGGGAIKGIGEKFAANPVTGTGTMMIPLATSPGRSGFGPQLSLSYDSGSGNGAFGLGWNLALPAITRKTEKGLPQYLDADESDVFILTGSEDLVPVLVNTPTGWQREALQTRNLDGEDYEVHRYRPRIEGLFSRIERWTSLQTGEIHWRSITRDNITTLYGRHDNSRIFAPANLDTGQPKRVFNWLICQSYDDKGNAIVYDYVAENDERIDHSQVNERNRVRSANRYLRSIKYGNRVSRLIQPNLEVAEWMFEVVFDYDEGRYEELPLDPSLSESEQHRFVRAALMPTELWPRRPDPFSVYRSGFEVRTYRRCHRVLMFHRFPELGGEPCLVRATEFDYADLDYSVPTTIEQELSHQGSTRFASFIQGVTQSGFVRDASQPVLTISGVNFVTYLKKSLPPIEFEYSKANIQDELREMDSDSLENLPIGLDGNSYQWVDLDGEGVTGILTEQADGWFYKRNLGEGKFGPLEVVASKPSLADLGGGRQQLLDLAGDGQLDLVSFAGPSPGFYERTQDGDWEPFKAFAHLPNIRWDEPNLRFVDLNGDGHADILITEDEVFTWHPSLAEAGFDSARSVRKPGDEEKGPRLVLADGTQSIYVADMCGDGLTDLVRVRNGEVCYWPSLGYGRFGAKVTMDNAPWFDNPDQFQHQRIRLADIDGSGANDIIYLGRDSVRIFFNRSGNGWSTAVELKQFPAVDNLASVTAADLLGNGTSCLVWSSALPSDVGAPMRYVDLMGGTKPHLLVGVINNLGAETRVTYAPSTRFYLEDRAAGTPWITRLGFPVHVVEQSEVFDHVSRTKLVTRYQYHHGYFDGHEREFRGFGKVEQWDTQTFSRYSGTGLFTEVPATAGEEFHLPPVRTVSWFHNGAFIDQGNISRQYGTEYYSGDPEGGLLRDTILPEGLTVLEAREACRALKGQLLRQEVYADDEGESSQHPYTVTEHAYNLRLLQPSGDEHHSVFYAYECESLSYHYERDPTDPRSVHQLTLEVDDYGNVTKSAAVAYPRRLVPDRWPEQEQTYVTYTESSVINLPDEFDWYRIGLPVEMRTYEVTGMTLAVGGLFTPEDVATGVAQAGEIDYAVRPTDGITQKRLIEHLRTLYRRDDLTGPCELGEAESLALPFESYKLAFTPGLVMQAYDGRVGDALLEGEEARYVHTDGDVNWWIPSGQSFYSLEQADEPAEELAFAREHFFLPHRFRDPFGNVAVVVLDDYTLLVTETRDPLENVARAVNHYRTLAPQLMTDPNGNRNAVRFDALAMVTTTFALGKEGRGEGDQFDETAAEVSPVDDPTTRLEYDLFNWTNNRRPNFVHTFAREHHGPSNPRWQESYSYSDGLGRQIEKKIQAEPGLAPARGADGELVRDGAGELVLAQTPSRWVGTGRTVFDNKGNPVKKYEPFFDSTHTFVDEEDLVEFGVTPILRYDPIGRLVRTDLPDGTLSRVEFDPWRQLSFDSNDTVLESLWYSDRGAPDPTAPEPSDQATRAAWLAAKHAGTPTVTHLDPLGRVFLTIADNGPAEDGSPQKFETRLALDIEGNQRAVTDALGRQVIQADYNMLGGAIHHLSMDSGERWTLANVADMAIRRWDSRAQVFSTGYDALRRPTHLFVRIGDGPLVLIERTVYGEAHPDSNPLAPGLAAPCDLNLRGRVFMSLDQAGIVTSGAQNPETNAAEAYDFKGNLLRGSRQFALEYKQLVDWTEFDALPGLASGAVLGLDAIAAAIGAALEAETFVQSAKFDALNRPVSSNTPDGSVVRPFYNEANLLERVTANLRASDEATEFVGGIDYDARGQRKEIVYGNGVVTAYDYDPQTFRLTRLRTTRGQATLQDLSYTYDPVGNITAIRDDAQQTIIFDNQVVSPSSVYAYDALYRLTHAAGREHAGQNAASQVDHDDAPRMLHPHPNDGQAMRRYAEEYAYDEVGNILAMIHRAVGGDWTRRHQYATDSNRLLRTSLPGDAEAGPFSAVYEHDAHGNMTRMPHLPSMRWDCEDQLASTQRQVVNNGTAETIHYIYNAAGERVRKVTEREAAPGATPARKNERFYLGGFEVYREYGDGGTTVRLERETLHVMDDKRRIAIADTKTIDASSLSGLPETLTRFQLDNHLGSAILELDLNGALISYEEYYPYGSTSYQSGRSAAEVRLKRYRYTGKERDEETGLYYHGARYYAPWLGRWTAADPAGLADGNEYAYARGDPVGKVDLTGMTAIGAIGGAIQRAQTAEGLVEPTPSSDRLMDGPGLGRLAAPHEIQSGDVQRGGTSVTTSTSYEEDAANFVRNAIEGGTGIQIPSSREQPAPLPTVTEVAVQGAMALANPVLIGFGGIVGGYELAEDVDELTSESKSDEQRMAAGGRVFGRVASIALAIALGSRSAVRSKSSPTEIAGDARSNRGGGEPDVRLHEVFNKRSKGSEIDSSSRGYDRSNKGWQDFINRSLRWWGGPGPKPSSAEVDLGHRSPFGTLRPGETSGMKVQLSSENKSIGATTEKGLVGMYREMSRKLGLDPHDPANPWFTRPPKKK